MISWEDSELREVITLTIMIYYSDTIQIKINKGKTAQGRGQEKPGAKWQLSSPKGAGWCFVTTEITGNVTHEGSTEQHSIASAGSSLESCWQRFLKAWLRGWF